VATIESTEWTFAADAAKWMSLFLHGQTKSPFTVAKVEQRSSARVDGNLWFLIEHDVCGCYYRFASRCERGIGKMSARDVVEMIVNWHKICFN